MNNQLIQIYDIASDAITKTGYTGIALALAGHTKTSGGYIWKYIDEEA